jgi:HNH endonuclease
MSETYVPAAMRRDVVVRAGGRCEYCGVPEGATLAPHEPDHIIAEQHSGKTELDNLAYACYLCNRFKGPNIATRDPQTGLLTPLFHPRTDHWSAHFRLNGPVIEPLTPAGRGTATLLRFNQERRIALRAELLLQGVYSPPG